MIKINNNTSDYITAFNQNATSMNYLDIFSYDIIKTNENQLIIKPFIFFNGLKATKKAIQETAITINDGVNYIKYNLSDEAFISEDNSTEDQSKILLYKITRTNGTEGKEINIEDKRSFIRITGIGDSQDNINKIPSILEDIELLKKTEGSSNAARDPMFTAADYNNYNILDILKKSEQEQKDFGLKLYYNQDPKIGENSYDNKSVYMKSFSFWNPLLQSFQTVPASSVSVSDQVNICYVNLSSTSSVLRFISQENLPDLYMIELFRFKKVRKTISGQSYHDIEFTYNKGLQKINELNTYIQNNLSKFYNDDNLFSLNIAKLIENQEVIFKNNSFFNPIINKYVNNVNGYSRQYLKNNNITPEYYSVKINLLNNIYEVKKENEQVNENEHATSENSLFEVLLYELKINQQTNEISIRDFRKNKTINRNINTTIKNLKQNDIEIKDFAIQKRKSIIEGTSYVYIKSTLFNLSKYFEHPEKKLLYITERYFSLNVDGVIYIYLTQTGSLDASTKEIINDPTKKILYKVTRKPNRLIDIEEISERYQNYL
jgi:hypothetical protein|nr:MAG TPA: hypothetical protein [Caudoviricetes sp.]